MPIPEWPTATTSEPRWCSTTDLRGEDLEPRQLEMLVEREGVSVFWVSAWACPPPGATSTDIPVPSSVVKSRTRVCPPGGASVTDGSIVKPDWGTVPHPNRTGARRRIRMVLDIQIRSHNYIGVAW